MDKPRLSWNKYLQGALGYTIGAIAGILFIFIFNKLGLARAILSTVQDSQALVKLVAIPLVVGLLLILIGFIFGGIGGWQVSRIIGATRPAKLIIGSGLGFGISTGLCGLIFLLLISFIGLYNNLSTEKFIQYGLLFGIFGLVYGLIAGIIQALTTTRLRYSWRVILTSVLGFTIGFLIWGLIIRYLNPTVAFKTYPWLTFLLLGLGFLLPYFITGGLFTYVYDSLSRRFVNEGGQVEDVYPRQWQTILVAIVGILIAISVFSTINSIINFVTIHPANLESQLTAKTIGTQWTQPERIAKGTWQSPTTEFAEVFDQNNVRHAAWCNLDMQIVYQVEDGPVTQIPNANCDAPPALNFDQNGQPHIVWHAHQLNDVTGKQRTISALMESIQTTKGWSEPALVMDTSTIVQPELKLADNGDLLLYWSEELNGQTVTFQASQPFYECDPETLTPLEQLGLQVINSGGFRPEGETVPYCQNHFDRIVYTPNPDPAFSDEPITLNGAFDQISVASQAAKYEVLFVTMQWEGNYSPPSPGFAYATEVAKLYELVKENPQNYPRGLTVRILLGNYPVVANFEWGSQILAVLSDLRDAGVEKMIDPEIGWRLEVANFAGTYPHSHSKFLVVDGKTVLGVGFNYGYLHLSSDHPSGQGYDMLDLGLELTGPIAQDAISTYDDLWTGADQIHCDDLFPPEGDDWQDTCHDMKAQSDHVPEVLRFYLPTNADSTSFSLYRSKAYGEADQFIKTVIANSTESIDMMEVNFSLQAICMINLLFPNACTFNDALPYMKAMVDSIENNGTHVRVMMENTNSNGIENRIGGMVLLKELQRRGLEDHVELRFYDGKIHAKSMLLDQQLLIIGSQNMHYSSWGPNALTEYSLTTTSEKAIAEYQALYEYKWQQAIPFAEAKYGTSP